LPAVGASVEQPTVLTVPTDGVVYDPELAHCCAQDPALEQAEGPEYFERQRHYLETVIALAETRSLSRIMYLAERG